MKKIYFLALSILTSISLKATIHNVSIQSNSFTPFSFTAEIGDTVRWTLAGGVHDVTSLSVPAGALTFASTTLTAVGATFDYKITTAGTYAYFCSIHGTGMAGGFVVNNPAGVGISKVSKSSELKAFPNPFKTKITIPNKDAQTIEIFSVLGEKVKSIDVTTIDKTTVDLSDLRKGVYFYALKDASGVIETRKIVKSE